MRYDHALASNGLADWFTQILHEYTTRATCIKIVRTTMSYLAHGPTGEGSKMIELERNRK